MIIWKHDYLIMQGKFSIHEADYMDAANTPDPGYVYDDDIKVAFNNQIKKVTRKSRVTYGRL